MVKVSVIIPFYNSDKFIEKCIASLLDQSLKECEFIFVDDGSVDLSMTIVNKYASLDSRIKVVSQNHRGVSSARNRGIRIALGKYMCFVDSDDFVIPTLLQKLYDSIERYDCDMVFCNYSYEIGGDTGIISYPFKANVVIDDEGIKDSIVPFLIEYNTFNTVCARVYRTRLINDNFLMFKEGVSLGEDREFNLDFLSLAHKLVYVDFNGYHYNENFKSATHNKIPLFYFDISVFRYKSDSPEMFIKYVNIEKFNILKSRGFVRETLSLMHVIVFSNNIKFKDKLINLNFIVNNQSVKYAVACIFNIMLKKENLYFRILLMILRLRLALVMYLFIFIVSLKTEVFRRKISHE